MAKRFFCALIFSLLAAVYGLGSSYESFMTPRHTLERFNRIHPDSWVEDGATIDLPRLARFANRITLTLNAWRPAGVMPAHFRVSVCGMQQADFLVERPESQFTFTIKGNCEPRRIAIEVVNPFVASASDARRLGAQLKSVSVTSRLGVVLVDPLLVGIVALALMVLWWIYDRALLRFGLSWLGLGLPLASIFFLSQVNNFTFTREWALWVLGVSFGIGIWVAERYLRARMPITDEKTRDVSIPVAAGLITLIVVIGGALRFYGIKYGLPSNYHPDEVPKVNAIMRMVAQGDLNPTYFLHPSLLLYSSYGLNQLAHFFGFDGDFRDSTFLAGRCVSAIAGTASLYLLYRAGVLLFSRFVGLSAAALLAVFPLHVTCSRYMKEDVLLLFFILLALVITLKAVYEDRKILLILAGFISGVSASSKYSGMLTILIVAGAPWLKSRSLLPDWSYLFYAAIGCAVAPLGFIACTPYSVLTPEKFLKDFNSERHHMERGHTIPFTAWSQYWTYHYWRSIVPGIGLIATILAIVAAGAIIFRWHFEGLFVIGLIVLFYLPAEYVKAKPAPQPERYILPCLPFIALAIAVLLERLRSTKIYLLVPILFIAAFLPAATRTVQLASEVPVDTRDLMAQWMKDNLPHGATVLLDWKPYCPRFWYNEFNVVYVPRAEILNNLSVEQLKKSGGQYLLLSSLFYDRYFSQPNLDPALREKFREVFGRVPIVKEYAPRYGTYGFNNPSLTLFSLKTEDFLALDRELAEQQLGEREKTTNQERTSFPWIVVTEEKSR
jgi:4-amino-4-deoxy-L-arabinose transferase-like glycosyltransferase